MVAGVFATDILPTLTMAGKSPYSTELIEQCVNLYKGGVSVETIAKNTGVPTRTLYRWCKTHGDRGCPVDPDKIASNDLNFQKTLKAKVMPHSDAVRWIDDVESTVNRLGNLHSDLIYDLHRLLNAAIHSADISPRSINTLSLALDRHMTGLLKVTMHGRERLIDASQAMSILESIGYMVFDSSHLQQMFTPTEEASASSTSSQDKNK